jgi:outer membrane protein OmpA-like peptidoglycan-associated protein
MPSSERQNALEDLVARMNNQTIGFGFRKIEPDSRGEKILQSYAKGMSLLPEYTLRIEGHSNLAKSESKLTAEDQARIQKLSEDRAEACAGFLKAAGVQNEITCVGQGALKGEFD